VNNRPAFGVSMGACFARLAALALASLLFFPRPALAQTLTPAGTAIDNVASVSFVGAGGTPTTVTTNRVSAIVTPPPTTSAIAILRAVASSGTPSMTGPTQCTGSSGTVTLAPPMLADGTALDASQPIPLASTATVHGGEATFVRVADADQNRDPATVDHLDVRLRTPSGDVETLRIAETGPNTGVFVGYIQTRATAVTTGNCVLEVERNAHIDSLYVDAGDAADTSSASALVDPYGLIFDSRTGTPINGARVRLIDAMSGLPATVVGDDAVSSYPSEMLTGSPVTDAGGTVYTLPAGVFRFPLVAPGNYRLAVDPPVGHAFPSALSIADLGQTPGGPYRIGTGSFGAAFTADTPPAVAIDVPLDAAATQLFVQKTTTTTVAAIGDFVQYQLTVENTATNAAVANVQTVDQLPLGARYRPGSTRIGAVAAPDPQISADGHTLTFSSGALGPGQRLEIRYVVEITAGAHGKQLVNAARAIGPDGIASNSAQSTIQLREELFRDRAIVMGRVVEGECASPTQQLKGVAGVRVYLEDGRYSVTDDEGKYHFEDVAPGSHVVQMDTVTVPETHQLAGCDSVRNAGRAYSQFVDVRGGALWRSDFVLARRLVPKGRVAMQLETAIAGPTQLTHTAKLNVTQLPIRAARVMLMLPEGLEYQAGSAQLDGKTVADPSISSNVLTFTLGDLSNDREAKLTLRTQSTADASGAISVKALTMFDTDAAPAERTAAIENVVLRGEMLFESASYRFTPRFDVLDVAIQAADRAQLDKIANDWRGVSHLRLTAVGHSDQLLIAARSRAAYPDNYALSRARADVVAKYLVERLNIDPSRVTIEGRGADEPLASGHDPASLALNRRVDISIEGLRIVAAGNLTVKTAAAEAQVETTGVLGSTTPATAQSAKPAARAVVKHEIDIEQLQPGTAWLLPTEDEIPSIPSIRIVVQHLPTQTVELQNNGAVVSPLNFDGVTTNEAKTVSLSRWRGVDLRDGTNELLAIVRDSEGNELQRLNRKVHYSGGAVRAEIVRESSTLVADGRTRPVIAVRMIDSSGKPARPGTQGSFSVQAPYRSWFEVDSLNDNKLVAVGTREPTFSVDVDGLARLELEPTTQAGTAILRLRFSERRQQEIRVWLEPQARDWVLVGLTENTSAYRTISDNMQSAADAGLQEGYSSEGRVAFFAKGAIKGEYLLTAAYDSARDHEVAKDRLLGAVEPDRFYTLYGDATEQRFEAATSRKLFVKLERRQFSALFGDFETGLTLTELTRYSRTFTGLKSDYAGDRFGYSAFAAESEQGYVKDELQGDGTSGLYRLSRRPIILNSDKIRLEVRDRFRSEVVVESRPLSPFVDYSLDYLNGTLFFKQPVPSRDQNFNPVYIVAEYEVLNGGEAQMTAGGRASVKLANDAVEIGASYLQEGATVGDTQIAGTDLRWQIGAATELRAEVARSESADPLKTASADAYLTEITHVSERLDTRAYMREQESGFGVGQQAGSEAGTRKVGVDGRYRLNERFSVEGETYRQEVLDTGAQRELVSAQLRRDADDYSIGAGARHVADSGLPSGDTASEQAFVNGSLDLFKDLITLRASQDFALGGKNSSVDFPARSVLGVDYHWRPSTTFFGEWEHANGDLLDADTTRLGVRTAPWERAQLQTSINQRATEFGPRLFANTGLTQGWQVNERWTFDFGVDQSKTLVDPDSAEPGAPVEPFNPNVPLASGTLDGDFVATFVGALYRTELWTFTSRLENRHSDAEDRRIVSGGFYREPVAGHAFSMTANWFDSTFATGADATAGEVQLGWSYRPATSAWIILDRLDLKHDAHSDASSDIESARAINNLNANWQLDQRTQLGLQFGGRYVRSTFDGERYSGLSTLYGVDVRRELTLRIDVGLHGTMLSSLESGVSDQSVGVDLGVTVARNVWISIGYNFAGFRDDDFEASRYTAQGPFIKFRMKADQDTFRDLMSGTGLAR